MEPAHLTDRLTVILNYENRLERTNQRRDLATLVSETLLFAILVSNSNLRRCHNQCYNEPDASAPHDNPVSSTHVCEGSQSFIVEAPYV